MEPCDNLKHYWVIPTSESDTKVKTCRVCNEVEALSPVPVDNFALPITSKNYGLVYGYKHGRPKGAKGGRPKGSKKS